MSDPVQREGASNLEPIRTILDDWVKGLAEVLESMADRRPDARWTPGDGAVPGLGSGAGDEETLWWEQLFSASPAAVLWVAAPRAMWEYAGTLTLQAAGLDSVAPAEVRNTWREILGQSLGVMARSISAALGREVTCESGVEREPGATAQDWVTLTLSFPEGQESSAVVVLGPSLLALLAAPVPNAEEGESAATPLRALAEETAREPLPNSRTMDLLLDVDLPVSISFGKTRLPLKEVLKLTTGSIVELNRGVNEQVEVLVNDSLIARGEVVVVEGNYGVRIQEIASRQERLRSVR